VILLFDKSQKALHDAYAPLCEVRESPKTIANSIEKNKQEAFQVEESKQEVA
jgi:hypothetical protein